MSEFTLHTDCGDGRRRADVGSLFNLAAPVAKTANYTISPSDVGKCFTNKGASGTVTFSLPAPKFGMWFGFFVTDAHALEVAPANGEKINNGTTKISGSTAQTCIALVFCADGANWALLVGSGTWTTS